MASDKNALAMCDICGFIGKRPVETDYRKWNDYWSALSDFILLKYKHTGCRK